MVYLSVKKLEKYVLKKVGKFKNDICTRKEKNTILFPE